MKKVLSIILCSLCLIFVSCNSDNDNLINDLKIIKTDIDFTAEGGSGSIVVESDAEFSASSNKDWCSVVVKDKTVEVTTLPSVEISNRTALVSIKSNGKTIDVPVVQAAAIIIIDSFDLHHTIDYNGGVISLPFKSTTATTIDIPESASDWLSYEIDKDNNIINFIIKPNDDKTPRGAKVSIKAGFKELDLDISQIELSVDDIKGKWNITYFDFDGEEVDDVASIDIDDDGNISLNTILGFSIPLKLENNSLVINGNTSLGKWFTYDLFIAIVKSDGYLTLSEDSKIIAVPIYEDGKLSFNFGYSKVDTMPDVNVVYFAVSAFSNGQYLGLLDKVVNLSLTR